MTVQIIDIAGQKIAMLPIADYERLLEIVEDKADIQAAERADKRREEGEEYLPMELANQIIAGENALRVWRNYRGITLDELGKSVSIGKSFLSQIENGIARGKPALWRKLAVALNVSTDDILPED
jgi:DNA-binding XRE family transcriptional regulator